MVDKMKSENFYQIIFTTLFGLLGSVLIGLVFFGFSIFATSNPNFQFVALGFSGALFFSLFEYETLKEQIFGFIIILVLQLVIFTGKLIDLTYFIRDLFFLGSLFLSVLLYHKFIKRNPQIKFYLRSFALILMYGLLNSLFGTFVYIFNTSDGFPETSFIYFIARLAILIGLGIGLGIDFYFQNKTILFNLLKIKTA
jgi:hypothetical protein